MEAKIDLASAGRIAGLCLAALLLAVPGMAQETVQPSSSVGGSSISFATPDYTGGGGLATQARQATQAQQYVSPFAAPQTQSLSVYQNNAVPGGLSLAPGTAAGEGYVIGTTPRLMTLPTQGTATTTPAEGGMIVLPPPSLFNPGPTPVYPAAPAETLTFTSGGGGMIEAAPPPSLYYPGTSVVQGGTGAGAAGESFVNTRFPFVSGVAGNPVQAPVAEVETQVLTSPAGNTLFIPTGSEVQVATPPPETSQTSTGGAVTATGGGEAGQAGNGAVTTATEEEAAPAEGGAATAEGGAGVAEGEAVAEGAAGAATATEGASEGDHDAQYAEPEKSKSQLEYEATLRATAEMNAAKERAQGQLGYAQLTDDLSTATESKQIMGAETQAMIAQLGEMIQGGAGGMLIAKDPGDAVDIPIDPQAGKELSKEEKRRRAAREKAIRDELERQRRQAQRDKDKADKELERRQREARYNDRKEREQRQRDKARELDEEQKKLKARGEDLANREKGMDTEDKNLRALEDEMKKDDPNCESSACQNVRSMRTDLQKERTQLQKDQTGFQKDAEGFNRTVKAWEADGRELKNLTDRGYGMNEAERRAYADKAKLDAIEQQRAQIEAQKMDLRRQAAWMEAEGGISEDQGDQLRSQMRALERLDGKLVEASYDALKDFAKSQSYALGLGAEYEAGAKELARTDGDRSSSDPEKRNPRPLFAHSAVGQTAFDDAQSWQNRTNAELADIGDHTGKTLAELDRIEGEIGSGNIPKPGGAADRAQRIVERLDEIEKAKDALPYDRSLEPLYKDYETAKVALETHERALQRLGDSTAYDTQVANLGSDRPPTFRSEAELQRQHSFTYTGPASLREEVMKERQALEKATADYLSVGEKIEYTRENSSARTELNQLNKEANALRGELQGLLPAAQTDLLAQDVGLYHASLAGGLPRGADGAVDVGAVNAGIGALAQQQMRLVQTSVELDAAKAAGNAEQVQQLQGRLGQIQTDLKGMGVQGEFVDGHFQPQIAGEGTGMMWNAARDQLGNYLSDIEKNRQEAGMANAELPKPGEAGKSAEAKTLSRLENQVESQRAALGDAAASPLREQAADVQALNQIKTGFDSQVASLDKAIGGFNPGATEAVGLVETRRALKIASDQVGMALETVEKKPLDIAARDKILDKTAAVVEKQQGVAAAAANKVDPLLPAAVEAERAADALAGAGERVAAAKEDGSATPIPAPTPIAIPGPSQASIEQAAATLQTPNSPAMLAALQNNREMVAQHISNIDEILVKLPAGAQEAIPHQEARKILANQLQGIDQALKQAPAESATMPPPAPTPVATETMPADDRAARKQRLEERIVDLDQRIQKIDQAMANVAEDSPQAQKLEAARQTYVVAQREFRAALKETEQQNTVAVPTPVSVPEAVPPPPPRPPSSLDAQVTKAREELMKIDGLIPTVIPGSAAFTELMQRRNTAATQFVQLLQRAEAERSAILETGRTADNLDPVGRYMAWVEADILAKVAKSPLAQEALPATLSGLAVRFGPEEARRLVEAANTALAQEGLGGNGLALLDRLLQLTAEKLVGEGNVTAAADLNLSRARIIAEALKKVGESPAQGEAGDAAGEKLQQRLDNLVANLRDEVGKELAAKPNDTAGQLAALSRLTILAGMPTREAQDLGALLNKIGQQLGKLKAAEQVADPAAMLNALDAQIVALEGAAAGWPQQLAGAEGAMIAGRLSQNLAEAYAQQRRLLGAIPGEGIDPAALQGRLLQATIAEASHRLGAGEIERALALLEEKVKFPPELQAQRDAALATALMRIRNGLEALDPATREKLGDAAAIDNKIDALLEKLAGGTEPVLARAGALELAQRKERAGDPDAARKILERAIKNAEEPDPVLLAEHLKLALAAAPEAAEAALAAVPAEMRLPAAILALDGLLAADRSAAARSLLDAVTKALPPESAETAPLRALMAISDVRVAAMSELTAESEPALRGKIEAARAALGRAEGLDETYRKQAGALLDGLEAALNKQTSLRESLASADMPTDGFANALREALSLGRYDLAEKALERQVEYLIGPESGDVTQATARLRETAGLVEMIQRRAAAPELTAEQRERMQASLGRMVPKLMSAVEDLMAQRRSSATNRLPDTEADRVKALERRQQALADLRALAQLKARTEMLLVDLDKRHDELQARQGLAGAALAEAETRIRREFAGLGKAITEDPEKRAAFGKALAELDALRAERDGIEDVRLRYAGGQMTDTEKFSFLPPVTGRDVALRNVQREIVGVVPGWSAQEIINQRKDLGNRRHARGLREDWLAERNNVPRSSQFVPGSEAMDYWMNLALIEGELGYLERRRGQLVWEDPNRDETQSAALLNQLYEHEAKFLEGLVSPSNAFSELNQKLSGFGGANREQAKALRAEFLVNEEQGLIGTFETARAMGDMQKAFGALVQLRERSLAGEIDAYVDYMNVEWYRAGPARAYNLVVGEEATRVALESATMEAGRVHAVLIRAANNPPESLSADDRNILTRHGFLAEGKYQLPEHVQLRPTTVASEFAGVTREGVLGRVDSVLNAAKTAELVATVVVPGGLAGRFARASTVAALAEGYGANAIGRLAALGIRLGVEAGTFTALSRVAQTALNPEQMADASLWTPKSLLSEFLQNYAVIGVLQLKGFGQAKALEALGKVAKGNRSAEFARALIRNGDPLVEAGLLTAMHNPLAPHGMSREDFIENLAVVGLLRAMHVVPEQGGKLLGVGAAAERAESIARRPELAQANAPLLGRTSRSWQRFYEWMDNYHLPARRLMVRYKGSWADARKDFQAGKLSENDMRQLVNLRKWVVDSLAAEIVSELKGSVQAFGSENLTSDYDISFVGPNAQAAVILFNARYLARWGAAVDIGGRETGIMLDTNAYTAPEHANFKGGEGDIWFQDAYAHLAARKYLNEAQWAEYRTRLESTADAARLKEMLDWAEQQHQKLQEAIATELANLEAGKTPASADELRLVEDSAKGEADIVVQNRLYEATLRSISELIDTYKKTADPVKRKEIAQQIRNAQSEALYFAQEAYQTQAAIDHVVMSIQAAKRKITAETLLGVELPKLNIVFTADNARQSYVEQIANMVKELSHGGDNAKLAGKAAKYFIRALDAARFAGVNLEAYRDLVEKTVEIEGNRAKPDALKESLGKIDSAEGGAGYVREVTESANELMVQINGAANTLARETARPRETGALAEPLEVAEMLPGEMASETAASAEVNPADTQILEKFVPPTDNPVVEALAEPSKALDDTIILENFVPPTNRPTESLPKSPEDTAILDEFTPPAAEEMARDPNQETAAFSAEELAKRQSERENAVAEELLDTERRSAVAAATSEGLAVLANDPAFARWRDTSFYSAEARSNLALIGQLRLVLSPAERAQADVALDLVERLMATNQDLAGIDLLAAAKHLNLHAGRVMPEGADAQTQLALETTALAIEAVRMQAPKARISIDSLIGATRLPGGFAVDAMNLARRNAGERLGLPDAQLGNFQMRVMAEAVAADADVLGRLDLDQLAILPRGNKPGDAAFYRANGLEPQLTVRAGDRTFHLSRPFLEREGKAAVIAFQETSFGTVVPRILYLSNEHGVWRSAIAVENNSLLLKGPRLYRVGNVITTDLSEVPIGPLETTFVNESAVDIAAELQPVLGRWLTTQGAMALPEAVRERAFFGSIENVQYMSQPREFGALIGVEEVRLPFEQRAGGFKAELQPDLELGALQQWQFDHPLYGHVTGQLYMTQNRQAVYVMLRAADGRTWVPSVQMATTEMSPFGTRWRSYKSGLTTTPLEHGAGADYVPAPKYENALNTAFP